ncbi:unnamed protein product [Laminaria digitata]
MAGDAGGAIVVRDGSSVSWGDGATFVFNRAGRVGGAVTVSNGSDASWGTETVFNSNSGALAIQSSHVSWSGDTSFVSNMVGDGGRGGALIVDRSVVSWSASTEFVDNTAGAIGGAAYVIENSTLCWSASATFSGNEAGLKGGALAFFLESNTSWDGVTIFSNNTFQGNSAGVGGGGAIVTQSSMSWVGEMEFFNNTAEAFGGAIGTSGSEISWTGKTAVQDNHAVSVNGTGGGIYIWGGSVLSWTGDTEFLGNTAGLFGGALAFESSSRASWSAKSTTFTHNSASLRGGALFLQEAEVSWSDETAFTGNEALSGGAIYIRNGSSMDWTGDTKFSFNVASADGGVVGSQALDSEYNPQESNLAINGSTTFSNNTCGANGGALALLGGLSVDIGTVGVVFSNNTAAVAGGAVFVSGTGVGPMFSDALAVSNSAQVGGAVSTVGSGNLKEGADVVPPNPTTFNRCRFIDNRAAATGGAIESAAGQDAFVSSVFENNQAGTGGALRLSGTASLDSCSFVENVSDDGGGAAVSNIGYVSKMENIIFRGNVFACDPGMFLDFNASDDPYQAACNGCQTTCDGCSFEEPPLVPISRDVMAHASSAGGTDTLRVLSIEPGYWRATSSSTQVNACYHADACLGGVTGTAGYCLEGYEGPYCSICSNGCTPALSFTCSKCSDSAGGIVLAGVLAVAVLIVAVAVVSYVISGKVGVGKRGMVARLGRFIPLQSLKIVIVAWQILKQFTSVANVTYPDVYQRFLGGLDVFNFDLSWVLSAGCAIDADFHDRLLMSTIGPIIALLFLGGTYAAATRINRGEAEPLQVIWNRHVSMVLLLTFFVYSSVSSTLFKTFACEKLEDGKNYLRADYRLECDSSKHKAFQVYAGFMIVVYTVGIPAFYGVLLFRDREVLRRGRADLGEAARVTLTSDLWRPYKPSVFYYEVIECARRVLLAGVVVFIYPNTAAQIAITLLMAFVFVVVSEGLAPYASRWDTWLSRMGHAVVYVSMYVALLLKVDVSDERAGSQKVFEAVLVAAHACMILVVVMETVVLACALRVQQRDGPSLRFGPAVVLEKSNPFSDDMDEVELSPVG